MDSVPSVPVEFPLEDMLTILQEVVILPMRMLWHTLAINWITSVFLVLAMLFLIAKVFKAFK